MWNQNVQIVKASGGFGKVWAHDDESANSSSADQTQSINRVQVGKQRDEEILLFHFVTLRFIKHT